MCLSNWLCMFSFSRSFSKCSFTLLSQNSLSWWTSRAILSSRSRFSFNRMCSFSSCKALLRPLVLGIFLFPFPLYASSSLDLWSPCLFQLVGITWLFPFLGSTPLLWANYFPVQGMTWHILLFPNWLLVPWFDIPYPWLCVTCLKFDPQPLNQPIQIHAQLCLSLLLLVPTLSMKKAWSLYLHEKKTQASVLSYTL